MEQLTIGLFGAGPYGLRLTGGGPGQPLIVAKMHNKSKARAAGVDIGDIIVAINGVNCQNWTVDKAMDFINSTSPDSRLTLQLHRGAYNKSTLNTVFESIGTHRKPNASGYQSQTDYQSQTTRRQSATNSQSTPIYYSTQLSTISTPGTPAVDESGRHHHISAVSLSTHRSITTPIPDSGRIAQSQLVSTSLMLDSYKTENGEHRQSNVSSWSQQTSDGRQPSTGGQGRRAESAWSPSASQPVDVWDEQQTKYETDRYRLEQHTETSWTPPTSTNNNNNNRPWRPVVWTPSSSLAPPHHVPRPVSAPPLGLQPVSDGGHNVDVETEVVIWSSRGGEIDQPQQHRRHGDVLQHDHHHDNTSDGDRLNGSLRVTTDSQRTSPFGNLAGQGQMFNVDDKQFMAVNDNHVSDTTDHRWNGTVIQPSSVMPVHISPAIHAGPAPPFFLTRAVVAADDNDFIDDYGLKKKKMFADSSFYEDPEQKYPTIEEQIKMARTVAHLLTSSKTVTGRGQQMFLKRQLQSDDWTAESAPAVPQTRRPLARRMTPEPPPRTPTSLEVLERLRLREAKTRHDVLPPTVFMKLADELQRAASCERSTAGRMFAKGRERAERSVVPEVPVQRRPIPMEVQHKPEVQERDLPKNWQQERSTQEPSLPPAVGMDDTDTLPVPRLKRMLELSRAAMTPWEAAAKYGGRVDPAFEHLNAYRAASTWTIADPDDIEPEIADVDKEWQQLYTKQQETQQQRRRPPRAQSASIFDHVDNRYQYPSSRPTNNRNYVATRVSSDWSTPGSRGTHQFGVQSQGGYRPVRYGIPN